MSKAPIDPEKQSQLLREQAYGDGARGDLNTARPHGLSYEAEFKTPWMVKIKRVYWSNAPVVGGILGSVCVLWFGVICYLFQNQVWKQFCYITDWDLPSIAVREHDEGVSEKLRNVIESQVNDRSRVWKARITGVTRPFLTAYQSVDRRLTHAYSKHGYYMFYQAPMFRTQAFHESPTHNRNLAWQHSLLSLSPMSMVAMPMPTLQDPGMDAFREEIKKARERLEQDQRRMVEDLHKQTSGLIDSFQSRHAVPDGNGNRMPPMIRSIPGSLDVDSDVVFYQLISYGRDMDLIFIAPYGVSATTFLTSAGIGAISEIDESKRDCKVAWSTATIVSDEEFERWKQEALERKTYNVNFILPAGTTSAQTPVIQRAVDELCKDQSGTWWIVNAQEGLQFQIETRLSIDTWKTKLEKLGSVKVEGNRLIVTPSNLPLNELAASKQGSGIDIAPDSQREGEKASEQVIDLIGQFSQDGKESKPSDGRLTIKREAGKTPELQAAIRDLAASDTRLKAARLLAQTKVLENDLDEVALALAKYVSETSGDELTAFIDAMRLWHTEESVRKVAELCQAKGTWERETGMKILAALKHPAGVESVAANLVEPRFADKAAKALIEMGKITETEVAKYLSNTEKLVRKLACDVLAEVGTKGSIPEIRKMLSQEKESSVLDAGKNAIEKILIRAANDS